MNASLIAIGDEILTGQTINTNSSWIAERLHETGIGVESIMSVADTNEAIKEALQRARDKSRIVIITGGLGPTEDDITKRAIGEFLGVKLIFNSGMYQNILTYFKRINRATTDAHKQQCFLPEGAILLRNNLGTAPGMWMEKDGFILLSLPGVPYEMMDIMENGALQRIVDLGRDERIYFETIYTAGIGEAEIERRIRGMKDPALDRISVAYLPGIASVKMRITAKGKGDLETFVAEAVHAITKDLDPYVIGHGSTTLAEVVGKLCIQKGVQMATAESCTGGHIAYQITSVPGSSSYFKGAIIAYSNEVKIKHLAVSEDVLESDGAVSQKTVCQMLDGVLGLLGVDVGIAISGIAGPSGGTDEKPVGTVWIAVGDCQSKVSRKFNFAKNRELNIKYASVHALNLLRLFLENKI